jgi:hypothetical protein
LLSGAGFGEKFSKIAKSASGFLILDLINELRL